MDRIGLDIGGSFIKALRLDIEGKRQQAAKQPTPQNEAPKLILQKVLELVESLNNPKNSKSAKLAKLDYVGIGIPGVLDRKAGRLIQAPNLPGWEDFPLQKNLTEKLDCPVLIENDANCAAIGELAAGSAKRQNSFLMITLGTGVGGGLVLNRKLCVGEGGMAGEFGHICVDPLGDLCPCGARGCLEVYSSAKGMLQMAKTAELKIKNVEELFSQSRKGNVEATRIIKLAGNALGRGIATVVQLLDIRFFVISGGISKSLDLLLPHIQEELEPRIYGRKKEEIKIVASSLGDEAGMYGAANLKEFIS